MNPVVAAASALVQKGQNALARFGMRVAASVSIANPAMRSAEYATAWYGFRPAFAPSGSEVSGFEFIRETGSFYRPSVSTRIAYIRCI